MTFPVRPPAQPPARRASDPYARMCAARAEFRAQWSEWLATNPTAEEIEDEVHGTESAMRQLAFIQRDQGR